MKRGEKGFPNRPSMGYQDGMTRDSMLLKAAAANRVTVDELEHYFVTGERKKRPNTSLKMAINEEAVSDEV